MTDRPTKKIKERVAPGGPEVEVMMVLCARCVQWTPRDAPTCAKCGGTAEWEKK